MHSGGFDPRAKFFSVILAVAATFTVNTLWGAGILLGSLFLVAAATKTPLRQIGRNLAFISWLLFMTGGLQFWGTISAETSSIGHPAVAVALEQSIIAVVRLVIVVGWVTIFNASSSPLETVAGFEKLLKPFQRFGLPVANISTVAMITLRFLPILFDEAQQLMQTLIARGIDWRTETWGGRARHLVFLCVALFNSLLRRVDLLTVAMENRGFMIGASRTSFYAYRLYFRDYLLLSCCLFGFIGCVLMRAR
ncbi:ABC transporter, permease protein [Candidatus Moduliflexus flocculans]|uniref:ABC transporter, permease protein n=1 Tax=Candidatus Moduliflexus flocculans TaxID=1499966 RepID=A0A0S6VR03_9BACT|nr:ABC transporter, permease protein [Candidatus Moduliflexus flocculans]